MKSGRRGPTKSALMDVQHFNKAEHGQTRTGIHGLGGECVLVFVAYVSQ